jgi:hemerythrin-like metal-binding protein
MHIRAEERLMEAADYPDIDEHRELHKEFAQQVEELKKIFRTEEGSFDKEKLLAYAQNWFFVHIVQEDKKYSAYI